MLWVPIGPTRTASCPRAKENNTNRTAHTAARKPQRATVSFMDFYFSEGKLWKQKAICTLLSEPHSPNTGKRKAVGRARRRERRKTEKMEKQKRGNTIAQEQPGNAAKQKRGTFGKAQKPNNHTWLCPPANRHCGRTQTQRLGAKPLRRGRSCTCHSSLRGDNTPITHFGERLSTHDPRDANCLRTNQQSTTGKIGARRVCRRVPVHVHVCAPRMPATKAWRIHWWLGRFPKGQRCVPRA